MTTRTLEDLIEVVAKLLRKFLDCTVYPGAPMPDAARKLLWAGLAGKTGPKVKAETLEMARKMRQARLRGENPKKAAKRIAEEHFRGRPGLKAKDVQEKDVLKFEAAALNDLIADEIWDELMSENDWGRSKDALEQEAAGLNRQIEEEVAAQAAQPPAKKGRPKKK